MRFVPYEPLELPPEERARRLALLEDEYIERTEGFDPDYEAWLTHLPADWWKDADG
jgi:hypothetical protein